MTSHNVLHGGMTRALPTLILAMVLGATGCQFANRFGAARDPFGPKAACALPPESTKEEIVAYLNKNILAEEGQPGLRGWKTESAKIRMHGFSASATLQVEAPNNLRLRVSQPLSNTAMLDIGSNSEQFWVWSKDSKERVILTCRHEDIPATAASLEMPFPVQPEWLMEVFGVVPLDPNEFRMERAMKGSPFVSLIADCHGPSGEPMQRIIQVNGCHGLVTLHELRNAEGKVIASASFQGHYHDPDTKLVLVKQIRIELPQEPMVLTLELDRIQVNPSVTQESMVFALPQMPGHRTVDLAEVARHHRGPTERADNSEHLSAPERPGRRQAPMQNQELEAPALGFERQPDSIDSAPGFQPPGGQFEMPSSEPEVSPAGTNFRGQSPAAAPPRKPGFWERLKSAVIGGPSSGASRPEGYSPGASRSSWGPPRLGLE